MKGKRQDLCCMLVKYIEDKVKLVYSDVQKNTYGASFDPSVLWNLIEQDGSFVE